MNLLFFQNCISPHQIPYIRECANHKQIEAVYLIVPRTDYTIRKNLGWDSSNLLNGTQIKLWLMPTDEQINRLLKEIQEGICLFSGIRADADVFHWFKLSLVYPIKRYIITEPPFIYNKPLWMHYTRFFLQDYKFVSKIDGVFGFGEMAVKYYRSISKKWKVFPFQYVTESAQRSQPFPNGKVKLLFVGSLIPRKNVRMVIEALRNNSNIDFTIVGDGKEKNRLEKLAHKNNVNTTFLGVQPMAEISNIMQQNDALILPSLHDGWGAVVNEAMTLGLYVIVSDRCGVKTIIQSNQYGMIYKYNDLNMLKNTIKFISQHIADIRKNTIKRIRFSKKLQGKVVADYFIKCLLERTIHY